MVAITGAQIKLENKWSDSHISDTNTEFIIDNVINMVNAEAGLSMSNLTGIAGAKTVTLSAAQEYVVKSGIALWMRAYLDKGPNVNVQSLGVSQIVSDPHYRFMSQVFMRGISRLRGRSFERV